MKVLLMTTPRPRQGDSPLHFGCGRPPQGLGFIAANLEEFGHETRIVDLYTFAGEHLLLDSTKIQNMPEQFNICIDDEIKDFEPDYIGMHISTLTHLNAYELSYKLKLRYPHIKQVCGGPHPTLFPESVPSSFDQAVKGAGEYQMLYIVNEQPMAGYYNDNGVFISDGRCMPQAYMHRLEWPDYDKFINMPYNFSLGEFGINEDAIILNTSRGCPYSCKFCAGIYVHPKYSYIPAINVVEHMLKLSDKYGIKNFYFREDNFTANWDRVDEYCRLLEGYGFKWVCESRARGITPERAERMARSGCAGLYIGCESGSNRVLHLMNKQETTEDYRRVFPLLRDNGINTYTTWMYGFPGERTEDMVMTQRLIDELKPTSADQFIFIGIPISDMYLWLDQEGHHEYKDKYGFIFPHGYLEKATALYGYNDPKVQYVRNLYGDST